MNLLYYDDNLKVLREHIRDETVDLPAPRAMASVPSGRLLTCLALMTDRQRQRKGEG